MIKVTEQGRDKNGIHVLLVETDCAETMNFLKYADGKDAIIVEAAEFEGEDEEEGEEVTEESLLELAFAEGYKAALLDTGETSEGEAAPTFENCTFNVNLSEPSSDTEDYGYEEVSKFFGDYIGREELFAFCTDMENEMSVQDDDEEPVGQDYASLLHDINRQTMILHNVEEGATEDVRSSAVLLGIAALRLADNYGALRGV